MIKKTIKATGIELSPAIDEAIDKVVQTIDKHVDSTDTSTLVEIEVGKTTNHHRSGDIFRAEINFHGRIGSLRSVVEKEDLYVALTAARDEITESLHAKKTKRIDFIRRGGLKFKNMLRGLPWRRGK